MLTEKGKNRYKALPVFGPKQVAATFHTVRRKQIPDTIYHTIRDFKLSNQNNQEFTFPADSHRITVVNFFFTRCQTFCPAMNKQMQRLAKAYGQNKLMQFVSISVDPAYDTPEVLSAYAGSLGANAAKWNFLTGRKELIYDLAKKDFLVDAMADPNDPKNFIHSPMLILLDPQKRIRGYYNSLSKEEVDKLSDEIKVLITEELRSIK
ncbi:MAG: SCO family protein [Sphingobacteriaceae bacterium]